MLWRSLANLAAYRASSCTVPAQLRATEDRRTPVIVRPSSYARHRTPHGRTTPSSYTLVVVRYTPLFLHHHGRTPVIAHLSLCTTVVKRPSSCAIVHHRCRTPPVIKGHAPDSVITNRIRPQNHLHTDTRKQTPDTPQQSRTNVPALKKRGRRNGRSPLNTYDNVEPNQRGSSLRRASCQIVPMS